MSRYFVHSVEPIEHNGISLIHLIPSLKRGQKQLSLPWQRFICDQAVQHFPNNQKLHLLYTVVIHIKEAKNLSFTKNQMKNMGIVKLLFHPSNHQPKSIIIFTQKQLTAMNLHTDYKHSYMCTLIGLKNLDELTAEIAFRKHNA